jgi:hypothetical protein
MRNLVLGAGALFLAFPGAALAQDGTPASGVFKNAAEIYPLCTSSQTKEVEACDWYLMAAHDMMKFYGDTNMGGGKICLPMGTKAIEVRNAVLAYWRADPDSRKYSAVSTTYNALVEKFPCK